MKTKTGIEIKHSVTNANLEQYTTKALAYLQGLLVCRTLHKRMQAGLRPKSVSHTKAGGMATSGSGNYNDCMFF